MRKFVLAVSVGMLMDTSFAGHLMAFQDSYVTPFGARTVVHGGGPPPCGAYYPTVTYGPGNRCCVSQLVQLPSGWWQPAKWCEIIKSN